MSETITEALAEMGKATTRDIAKCMKIEPADMLVLLQEVREAGAIEQVNGFWSLVRAQSVSRAPVSEVMSTLTAAGGFDIIKKLLLENGPLTTAEIAKKLKRNSRALNPIMYTLSLQRKIKKNGTGKAPTWSLPEQSVEPKPATDAATSTTTIKPQEKNSTEIAETTSTEAEQLPAATPGIIPPVAEETEQVAPAEPESTQQEESSSTVVIEHTPHIPERRPDDLIIPPLSIIENEIVLARARLADLEKLRDAIEALGQHRNILQQLMKKEAVPTNEEKA